MGRGGEATPPCRKEAIVCGPHLQGEEPVCDLLSTGVFIQNRQLQFVSFQCELESLNHLSWQLFLKPAKGGNSSRY
jgi:hypothetical protein